MFGLTEKVTGIIGGAMAFAMVGFAVALFITRGTLETRTAERDAAVAQAQTEQAKHAVTRQSLGTALASIADMTKAVEQLKAEGDARADAAQKAIQNAQEAARDAKAAAEALDTSAGLTPPDGACAPSKTYERVRESL